MRAHTQTTHTHTLLLSVEILGEEYKEYSGWLGLGAEKQQDVPLALEKK